MKRKFDVRHNSCPNSPTYQKNAAAKTVKRNVGKGSGYYVATRSNHEFYLDYLGEICKEAGIAPIMPLRKPI